MHDINQVIWYHIEYFLLCHISSTTYFLQGNGQVESTNKIIENIWPN
jgi:hypothetical protein